MAKPTRVALLDGGSMFAKEYQLFWNLASERPVAIPTFSVLIDHQDGLFLFDTGFDLHHFEGLAGKGTAAATQTLEQTLPAQLKLLGLSPDDVTHVVNSHYHFDHCGGNKHCRHATTICHACELESSLDPYPFETMAYSDRSFLPEIEGPGSLDIYTPYFETLRGDQEIAAGLHLFETPGHTEGHYCMMVKLEGRRPMMFTGDACYSQKGLDLMAIPSAHVDPVRSYQSLEKLKSLSEKHDAEIFFSHDEVNYPKYRKAPYWYE